MAVGGLIVLAAFYAELAAVDAGLLFLSLIAAAGPLPLLGRRRAGNHQAGGEYESEVSETHEDLLQGRTGNDSC